MFLAAEVLLPVPGPPLCGNFPPCGGARTHHRGGGRRAWCAGHGAAGGSGGVRGTGSGSEGRRARALDGPPGVVSEPGDLGRVPWPPRPAAHVWHVCACARTRAFWGTENVLENARAAPAVILHRSPFTKMFPELPRVRACLPGPPGPWAFARAKEVSSPPHRRCCWDRATQRLSSTTHPPARELC